MTRIEHDRYYTPADVAEKCVNVLPSEWSESRTWDPHCGEGAFTVPLWKRFGGGPPFEDDIALDGVDFLTRTKCPSARCAIVGKGFV